PTANIHKLADASKKNIRIRDCLILYCALSNTQRILNKFTNNKYSDVLNKLDEYNFLSDDFSDFEFKKIYTSYQHKIKVIEYSDITKEKAHENIIRIMSEKGITNYRVYKDLKLNPGNINDYLTNNNVKKVSLDTVKRIYNYVSSF
ncbi:MAG: hypothetical protein J5618_00975, partial [Bacilli bacterium]|nr:hypothetical protein [Bacilli bacterium]